MRSLSPFVVAVLLAAAGSSTAAQTFYGAVRGIVRDANGGIAGAVVTLADEQTGATSTAQTNQLGMYAFVTVVPGAYSLSVHAPSFPEYQRSGLRVGTQDVLTVDVILTVAAFAQSVTVRGDAPRVESSNASVTALIDRTALETLPSAGRNVFFTATSRAMVVPSGDSQFVRQQDQSNSSLISVAGGPRRANSYMLDGVPIVDILNRATFIPSFEAVEEMRVQSSAYDAHIGRTSGAVFNTVARSGTNTWTGSALYQNRPPKAQARLFFAAKNDLPKTDVYYHLYGASGGGPIIRNRTFMFAATEGYRSRTSRSTVLVLPTEAERRGDFSQSGVTIYDPLTTRRDPNDPSQFIRDPFPDNRIPVERLNRVSLALLEHVPPPSSGTLRPASADIVDSADQVTAKVTHLWSDTLSSSALYAWYGSLEPDARFYGGKLFENGADPGDGALVRRVHLLASNNNWVRRGGTVLELRVGANRFLDDNRPASFDPSGLGFAAALTSAAPEPKFPVIGVVDYGRGGALLGDRDRSKANYYAYQVSAAGSRLTGRHGVKFGGEYRVTGVSFVNFGGIGTYSFTRAFTLGPNPNRPDTATGNAFASFLLGYPAGGSIFTSSPLDIYLRYAGGFVQDDVRVTSRLTVNVGLRYEFEDGLREREDRLIVGWAGDEAFPLQVAGVRPDGSPLALSGGVMYAGVDGAPRHQGNPRAWQFAPRAGVAFVLTDRTIVRSGYGLFYSPMQGISADEFGSATHGYNRSTGFIATAGNPLIPCAGCSLSNPFPAGIDQPLGSSLGRLTGVGGTISFVDPQSHMGRLHRYSGDVQHELSNQIVVHAGYVGARGRDLAGGLSGAPLSVNQLDPKYLVLGTALQEAVPNPFFGTPLAVGILNGPTVPRGQLLRPYPQFDTVYRTRSAVARSQYHALVAGVQRRFANRWSAQADYTWSRQTDSQFAESNFFAGGSAILNNYDVDGEYARSVLDAPHRLNISASAALPYGVLVSIAGVYQSGFPVTVQQSPNNSNLIGSTQRPNVVSGVNPLLSDHPQHAYDGACGCIRWLNAAAWSQAAPFTFGNAPRTDGRARTPSRQNWDLAIQKSQRIARATLSLRAEVINLFNFADLRGPSVQFGDASFGQIREAAGFPRMMQISTRIAW